ADSARIIEQEMDMVRAVFTCDLVLKALHRSAIRHVTHMRGNSHLRGEALSTTNRGLKLTLIKITRSDVNATLHKRQHQIQPNSGCSPGDDCEAITETLEHGHTARILIEVCSTVCRERSFLGA